MKKSRTGIILIAFLFLLTVIGLPLYAKEYYKIVEMRGTAECNGKPLKVGDIYAKGEKVDWRNSRDWIRAVRNDEYYIITPKGIKKEGAASQNSHIQLQAQTHDLAHRTMDSDSSAAAYHYSRQHVVMVGKKDFLWIERPLTEKGISAEAVWERNGREETKPIEIIEKGGKEYYVVKPDIFGKISMPDTLCIRFREKGGGSIKNAYHHGISVVYFP